MLPYGISGTRDRGVEQRHCGGGFAQSTTLRLSRVSTVTAHSGPPAAHSVCTGPPSQALSTQSWMSLSVSPHHKRSGMWSIPSRKLQHQQHCLWMLTLGQGQATPGTVIIVSMTCADLGLLEPFHVWEAMRSWKTLPSALANRNVARWLCHQPLSTLYSIWWKWTKWKLMFTEMGNNRLLQHVGLLWVLNKWIDQKDWNSVWQTVSTNQMLVLTVTDILVLDACCSLDD